MVAHRLQVPNVRLAVETNDGKPSVAFIHGFGGNLRTWNPIWDILPNERSYLRYDLRGFGESIALSDKSFRHVDDLLALLELLSIERCDLVGVSMGGSIAIHFALEYPEHVRSLSLISPGLTAWEWSDAWRALRQPIVAAAREGRMQDARALWLAHPLFETTRMSAAAAMLAEEIAAFSGAQWVEDHEMPALPDVDRLHLLDLPILLLTGGRDFSDFRLIADLIEAAAPDVSRYDEPALGHLLHIESPAECCERLTRFWRGLDTGNRLLARLSPDE